MGKEGLAAFTVWINVNGFPSQKKWTYIQMKDRFSRFRLSIHSSFFIRFPDPNIIVMGFSSIRYISFLIYGRSGPTTPPALVDAAPVDPAPNPCGPNTHPAPNLSGPRSIRPHITKHKICTSIYQPCPVRPLYWCTRRSIRPTFLYTYSWSGPMQLSMKFAPPFTSHVPCGPSIVVTVGRSGPTFYIPIVDPAPCNLAWNLHLHLPAMSRAAPLLL